MDFAFFAFSASPQEVIYLYHQIDKKNIPVGQEKNSAIFASCAKIPCHFVISPL
jgi:hypothetical protein